MAKQGEIFDKILFYEGPWYCFSNFASFMVYYAGIDWMTSEHVYQASKFMGNPTLVKAVRSARSAHHAKKIAQANKSFRVANWQDIKLVIMDNIIRAKLEQHPYVQKKLMETGDLEIVEDSPTDAFWGRGPDGNGLNHMGKIWMKLREELWKQKTKSAKLVAYHDDPPCTRRLDSYGNCPECKLHPDMQSIAIYWCCSIHDIPLIDKKCPECPA